MIFWLLHTPWLACLVPPHLPPAPGPLLWWVVTGTLPEPQGTQEVPDSGTYHTWHALGGYTFVAGRGDVPLLALGLYTAAASVTMGLSALYHTCMPATRTARQYAALLKTDVAGVWLVNIAGWALSIYPVGACVLPLAWRTVPVALAGAATLILILTAASPAQRGIPLLMLAAARLVGFPLRAWWGLGWLEATGLWTLSEGLALLGGVVNVLRIPERWSPGAFDVFFNSHTIMHVVAVAAISTAHVAAGMDRAWVLHGDHHATVCLAEESHVWLVPARRAFAWALGVNAEGG